MMLRHTGWFIATSATCFCNLAIPTQALPTTSLAGGRRSPRASCSSVGGAWLVIRAENHLFVCSLIGKGLRVKKKRPRAVDCSHLPEMCLQVDRKGMTNRIPSLHNRDRKDPCGAGSWLSLPSHPTSCTSLHPSCTTTKRACADSNDLDESSNETRHQEKLGLLL